MICTYTAERYCRDDVSRIENYSDAIRDNTTTWNIHHRLETDGEVPISTKELKEKGLYYDRPSDELIFLTPKEHRELHSKHPLPETHLKRSRSLTGRPVSSATREKISLSLKGHAVSDEARLKQSEAKKGKPNGRNGKPLSEDTKKKISETKKLRKYRHSDDAKRKISEASKRMWEERKQ